MKSPYEIREEKRKALLKPAYKAPLTVQAKEYAEGQADTFYLQVWPLDAARLERALANAFEAGWRARG